jgi:hypothetical protein
LVGRFSERDPAGTAKWASELPVGQGEDAGGLPHPAIHAVHAWLRQDQEAAKAWLLTQPADAPWVAPFGAGETSPDATR